MVYSIDQTFRPEMHEFQISSIECQEQEKAFLMLNEYKRSGGFKFLYQLMKAL